MRCVLGLIFLVMASSLPVAAPAGVSLATTMQCVQEGEPRRRVRICTRLIESGVLQSADLLWAYNSRAIARFQLGDIAVALGDLQTALELDPTFAPAYYTRGEINRRIGEYDKAIHAFDQALQAIENGGTWLGSETKDGSVAHNADLRVSILLSRSAAYIALGRLVEAERDCQGALLITSDDPRPLINLGYISALRGDYRSAVRFYEKASALAPGDPQIEADLKASRDAAGMSNQ